MPMPMKTHLVLNIITTLFLLTGGTTVLFFLKDALGIRFPVLDKPLSFAAIGGLVGLWQYIFWRWIPAACPKCGGRAFPKVRNFGRYICRDCGVESKSGLSPAKPV